MKKFIIIGTLLLAAVFMSGCITAPASDDPVVGIWSSEEDITTADGVEISSVYYVFNADGTGFELAQFAGTPVSGKLDFTWINAGNGAYSVQIQDTKKTGIPQVAQFTLFKDSLIRPVQDFEVIYTRADLADYAAGLWTGGRMDYNEYTDVQGLLYLGEDGKANIVVYGPDVLSMEDVFKSDLTWKVEGGKVILTGPQGVSIDASFVNGELVLSGLYPAHKYTIEDNLYGLWQSDEPYLYEGVSYDIVEIIKSDGTGVELWTIPGSDKVSSRYTFTWKMIDSVTYEASYSDGSVWRFESVATQLFDGETWYNKVGFDVLQEYAENKVTA